MSIRQRKPIRTSSGEDVDSAKKDEKPVVMLKDNSSKWRSYWTRFVLTWSMLAAFAGLVYLGHAALTVLVFLLQMKAFQEIIKIGGVKYRSKQLPLFRTINWYFVFAANYFLYGEGFGHYYAEAFTGQHITSAIKHHRFISFSLYAAGFVSFVLCLKKGHYVFQFTQFGFTHLCILLVVVQSHLLVQNIYRGLVWFLVPSLIVVCNDIMAYMFGFFFGRTPLIKLSPKKTWEGFIGAFFSTIIFAVVASVYVVRSKYFLCPVEYLSFVSEDIDCQVNPAFIWTTVDIPPFLIAPLAQVGFTSSAVMYLPFMVHAVSFAVFASLIAPFGGFFASGFKRAFEIKDFDDLIPGHGGVVDRMDCQLGMATFVHVYYSSWIEIMNVDKILLALFSLPANDQLMLFQHLNKSLAARGLLPG